MDWPAIHSAQHTTHTHTHTQSYKSEYPNKRWDDAFALRLRLLSSLRELWIFNGHKQARVEKRTRFRETKHVTLYWRQLSLYLLHRLFIFICGARVLVRITSFGQLIGLSVSGQNDDETTIREKRRTIMKSRDNNNQIRTNLRCTQH